MSAPTEADLDLAATYIGGVLNRLVDRVDAPAPERSDTRVSNRGRKPNPARGRMTCGLCGGALRDHSLLGCRYREAG